MLEQRRLASPYPGFGPLGDWFKSGQMNLKPLPNLALAFAAWPSLCQAEGIALGNPLVGASAFWLWIFPVLASLTMLCVMLADKALHAALLHAILLCAFVGSAVALTGNDLVWLISLVLSPWISCVLILFCLIVGSLSKVADRKPHGAPPTSDQLAEATPASADTAPPVEADSFQGELERYACPQCNHALPFGRLTSACPSCGVEFGYSSPFKPKRTG